LRVGPVLALWADRRHHAYHTSHVPLWPARRRPFVIILMLAAVLLFAGAKGVPWVKRIVRHPMLWGIGLLGVAHLLVNGDLAGVILFGGLAVFGFAWQSLTDRRDAASTRRHGPRPAAPPALAVRQRHARTR
jgi:uncharacterized membrane protein